MKKMLGLAMVLGFAGALAVSAQSGTSAIHGTVKKIDTASKTMVHGTVAGTKGGVEGLTVGSEVVARYTTKGTEKTALEVDKVGKEGSRPPKARSPNSTTAPRSWSRRLPAERSRPSCCPIMRWSTPGRTPCTTQRKW
jgi:hypothetical protein